MANNQGRGARVGQFEQMENEGAHPIVCSACMGPTELLRMTRQPGVKNCALCQKRFCLFLWKVSTDARTRSTIICQMCAISKGKCQCCLKPNGRRRTRTTDENDEDDDEACMTVHDKAPQGRSARTTDRNQQRAGQEEPPQQLRPDPQPGRQPCIAYARGECNAGASCPYRHDIGPGPQNGSGHGSRPQQQQQQQQQMQLPANLSSNFRRVDGDGAINAGPSQKPQQGQQPRQPQPQKNGAGFGFNWMDSCQE